MTPTTWIRNVATKIWNFGEQRDSTLLNNIGWHTVGTLNHYYKNDYENAYPSIRVLTQRFSVIEPYTIDKGGKSVASNVLDRIYTPNQQMSAYDFREALAVMSCVHNKVYIRVMHKGIRITADSITGFIFLEGVAEHIIEGKMYYWLPNGEKLGDDEVIVLKSINPYNLASGFSMAYASRRWTTLDDYIADYQAGFFKNGAVPAGQFIITAKTGRDFKDIVENIKLNHKGAGNSNGVMYAHRPLDANGKQLDSQVEWQPFSTTNKDMALKDLFEQANKKIDSTYGVPASLRGVNDTNSYASVRVDEQLFTKYTLEPFATKIWSRFTHELTRITGGMGLAISCEIEMPVVADEEKVKAESIHIQAQTITTLTDAGYDLKSVLAYLDTGLPSALILVPKEQDKPEVLTPEEAKDTPEQPVDLTRRTAKALTDTARTTYEQKMANVITERMTAQVESAMQLANRKEVTPEQPVDDKEDELLMAGMLAVVYLVMKGQGPIEHQANAQILIDAGIGTENISPFELTGAQKGAYKQYLSEIATSYNAQTAERIRNVLEVGITNNQTRAEIQAGLKALLEEQWRIDRLAITEVNLAGNNASLFSMQNISRELGVEVNKIWLHSGGDSPCAYCQGLVGTSVPLNSNFVDLGDTVEGTDGGIMTNDWRNVDTGGLHAHCHCRQTYEVIGA